MFNIGTVSGNNTFLPTRNNGLQKIVGLPDVRKFPATTGLPYAIFARYPSGSVAAGGLVIRVIVVSKGTDIKTAVRWEIITIDGISSQICFCLQESIGSNIGKDRKSVV